MQTQQQLQPSARQLDTVLEQLTHALASNAPDDAAALFAEECFWRDLVMFTWNIRTMEGRDQIRFGLPGSNEGESKFHAGQVARLANRFSVVRSLSHDDTDHTGSLFEVLERGVRWRQERREMYERVVDVPRLLCFIREGRPAPDPAVAEALSRILGSRLRNELGTRVHESICRDCWDLWLKFQTALINHHGLDVRDQPAREFLMSNMDAFLFKSGQTEEIDTSQQGKINW